MLERLISRLTEPYELKLYRKLRKQKLRRLKQYCIDGNIGFYPHEMRSPTLFATEVNAYIEERARRDLPQSQFDDSVSLFNPSDWVEIGGFLGYDGNIFEMSYSPPTNSGLQFESKPWGGIMTASSSSEPVKLEDFKRTQIIIHWHSHLAGFGELSEGDMDNSKDFLRTIGDKPIYYVVFRPSINRAIWYDIRKV